MANSTFEILNRRRRRREESITVLVLLLAGIIFTGILPNSSQTSTTTSTNFHTYNFVSDNGTSYNVNVNNFGKMSECITSITEGGNAINNPKTVATEFNQYEANQYDVHTFWESSTWYNDALCLASSDGIIFPPPIYIISKNCSRGSGVPYSQWNESYQSLQTIMCYEMNQS